MHCHHEFLRLAIEAEEIEDDRGQSYGRVPRISACVSTANDVV
jgi:hypothetical protein